jgi:hypothetical protein
LLSSLRWVLAVLRFVLFLVRIGSSFAYEIPV